MLIEDTPVPDAALPVEAFKAHLRLGTGFGTDDVQDVVLRSFLRAAMAAIESRTGKALLQRVFRLTVNRWRDAQAQSLSVAPVTGISELAQIEQSGVRSVVEPGRYRLERDAQYPLVRPTGIKLPAVPVGGSVEITFSAGFGVGWDDVPADLQQAVLMLAAHYYEYRNDTGLSEGCMPFGVSSLIERYRALRLGARSVR